MNRTNRIYYVIRNLIWSMPANLISIVMPFVSRTFMVRYMGSEYLGLNGLCTSILYVLNAVDLGISNAFAYRLYKPVAMKDIKQVCSLLNYFRKIYLILGIIIALLGIGILPFLSLFISGDIPPGVNIYIVFSIYLVNTVLTYVCFGYKELLITAQQRKDLISIVTCIGFIFLYSLQIYFIIQKSYYFYLIVLPISTFLMNILKAVVAKKYYPECICRGNVGIGFRSELRHDIVSIAVYRLRDMSRTTFDSICISSFCGLAAVAYYENYNLVLTVPILLRMLISSALVPSLGNFVALETQKKVYDVYHTIIFGYLFFSSWFALCYRFLIQDFITIWLGREYLMSNWIVILFTVYYYLLGVTDMSKILRETAGLWRYGRQLLVLEMLLNLVLNFILVKKLGMIGVLVGTVVSMLILAIPVEHSVIYLIYFKGQFWKRTVRLLVENLFWTGSTGAIIGVLCDNCPDTCIISFLMKILCCTLVPCVTFWVLYYKTDEFRFYIALLKDMINKFRRSGGERI